MRRISLLVAGSLALFAASCGHSTTEEPRQETTPLVSRSQELSAQAPPTPQASPSPKIAAKNDSPAPPRDAQFTIAVKIIDGPGHVERVKQIRDELIKATGMKGWYVSHEETASRLSYGYYKAVDSPQLKADREKISRFQDSMGAHPFADAVPVAINSPDPVAPSEFNLVNARGYWSLQIAVYQGPGRKEAAVEAVKLARKLGEEAYYHHGPNVSAVCMGSWPEEAIRKQEFDGGDGVDRRDQQRPLLLLGPGAELPDAVKEEYARNLVDKDSGKRVQVLEQKVEVVDPTFRAMMEKYPHHVLNGMEEVTDVRNPATGQLHSTYKPTLIVPIPHTATVLQSDPSFSAPGLLAPQPMQPAGTGQLRSLGQ